MRRSFAFVAAVVLVGACSSPSASPSLLPTPSPTATTAPTPTATQAASAPSAALPYAIDLPPGWVAFDLSNPAAQTALDAFVQANPAMAGMIAGFKALKNASLYIQSLLGNILVVIPLPSNGVSLATLGPNLTAQFKVVPGVVGVPVATSLTLPIGDALHWPLSLSAAKPGGGTITVEESIYLVVNAQTALIVEFVTASGGTVPDEGTIIQSLRFQP